MSPWRQTDRQYEQTESENRASQLIDKGLLTFANGDVTMVTSNQQVKIELLS